MPDMSTVSFGATPNLVLNPRLDRKGDYGESRRQILSLEAAAVAASRAAQDRPAPFAGCPGSRASAIARAETETEERPAAPAAGTPSRLRQWPVQIKLMPVKAPYYDGADLLIAADCAAYAYGAFHRDFIKNRITLIGCPKLDGVDYADKLTEILRSNDIRSLTVVRMEVPCCGGLELAAKTALQRSGRFIPWQVVTLSADGRVLE